MAVLAPWGLGPSEALGPQALGLLEALGPQALDPCVVLWLQDLDSYVHPWRVGPGSCKEREVVTEGQVSARDRAEHRLPDETWPHRAWAG